MTLEELKNRFKRLPGRAGHALTFGDGVERPFITVHTREGSRDEVIQTVDQFVDLCRELGLLGPDEEEVEIDEKRITQ